jgi:hypothetical protein
MSVGYRGNVGSKMVDGEVEGDRDSAIRQRRGRNEYR